MIKVAESEESIAKFNNTVGDMFLDYSKQSGNEYDSFFLEIILSSMQFSDKCRPSAIDVI